MIFQVERGYSHHRGGIYDQGKSEFSTTKWGSITNMYLVMIKRLTDDQWKLIFDALYRLEETRRREAEIEVGAEDEEYEALLPPDPPSSPPS